MRMTRITTAMAVLAMMSLPLAVPASGAAPPTPPELASELAVEFTNVSEYETMAKTPDGRLILVHKETGERVERHPVDAKGMIASGEYEEEKTPKEQLVAGGEGARLVPGTESEPINPALADHLGDSSQPGTLPAEENPGNAEPLTAVGEPARSDPAPVDRDPVSGLPRTTPLGQPAVHSTSADARQAGTGPQAKRTGAKK